MNINKTTLPKFRNDFADAVKELEAKYGVKINVGTITFDSTQFHGRLTVTNVGATPEDDKKNWENLQKKASWKNPLASKVKYGEWYIGNDGRSYKVVGFNLTRPKNILQIAEKSGKTYMCPPGFLGIFAGRD